jgi:hypothetical protein
VNVKLLVIMLRDSADPMRMSARKCAPTQLKFMRHKIRQLEELGLVYKNTGAEWASPPLILSKPGPDQYRMTVDMRVPNASTKPTAWLMPNLQDEMHDLHGSEVFATLDFCQGYWQIPLHKDSQDCKSYITPDGVYIPTRVLHGTRNATQHLQSALVVMMHYIKSNIKVWLDDCLLHTKTEDDLLATLKLFFQTMSEEWIEAACQQVRVVCNHGAVLSNVDNPRWSMHRSKEYGSAAENAEAADRHQFRTVCRGSKVDAKRDTQLLDACGPSSSSTGGSVRGYKPQDKGSCSRSVAATPLGTRGASGFQ